MACAAPGSLSGVRYRPACGWSYSTNTRAARASATRTSTISALRSLTEASCRRTAGASADAGAAPNTINAAASAGTRLDRPYGGRRFSVTPGAVKIDFIVAGFYARGCAPDNRPAPRLHAPELALRDRRAGAVERHAGAGAGRQARATSKAARVRVVRLNSTPSRWIGSPRPRYFSA